MVLCRYCGLFFAPAGAKNNPQAVESDRQAKVLYLCSGCQITAPDKSIMTKFLFRLHNFPGIVEVNSVWGQEAHQPGTVI